MAAFSRTNWQMKSLLTCFWGNSTRVWWNSTSRSLSAPASLSSPRTGTCSSGRPWLSDCAWGLGLMSPGENHSAGTKSWYLSCIYTHTYPQLTHILELWGVFDNSKRHFHLMLHNPHSSFVLYSVCNLLCVKGKFKRCHPCSTVCLFHRQ